MYTSSYLPPAEAGRILDHTAAHLEAMRGRVLCDWLALGMSQETGDNLPYVEMRLETWDEALVRSAQAQGDPLTRRYTQTTQTAEVVRETTFRLVSEHRRAIEDPERPAAHQTLGILRNTVVMSPLPIASVTGEGLSSYLPEDARLTIYARPPQSAEDDQAVMAFLADDRVERKGRQSRRYVVHQSHGSDLYRVSFVLEDHNPL